MRHPNEVVKVDGHNYKIYTDDHAIVVAVCKNGNHSVRGIAKCSENDYFDYEFGKKLAILRCDIKIETEKIERMINYRTHLEEVRYNFDCDIKNANAVIRSITDRYLDHTRELRELTGKI